MIDIPGQLNIASLYLEKNIERGLGDKVAVYYKDETYTYGQISSLSNKVGNVLKDIWRTRESRSLTDFNYKDRVLKGE
ncbi:MAG: hypothetical protein GY859_11960 [Desulfobacterales bacterium]|nr:hypothetical protein [Desulfobacterales bacterium]